MNAAYVAQIARAGGDDRTGEDRAHQPVGQAPTQELAAGKVETGDPSVPDHLGDAMRLGAPEHRDFVALQVIDDYTFKFIFDSGQSNTVVGALAYIQGCPGPSHVLKASHPSYKSDKTCDVYLNAMPADQLPIPVLGAWVPVEHKPDDLVVMRRNRSYFKVDDAGNQLPYINEMQFKLTTWDDRTTQAIAGTGDRKQIEAVTSQLAEV